MNLDQLKAIEARDLDALFAERVAGYTWHDRQNPVLVPPDLRLMWDYGDVIENPTLGEYSLNLVPVWSLEQIAEFADKVNDEDAVGFVQAMHEVLGAVMRFPTAVFFVSREDRMRVLIWAKGMG